MPPSAALPPSTADDDAIPPDDAYLGKDPSVVVGSTSAAPVPPPLPPMPASLLPTTPVPTPSLGLGVPPEDLPPLHEVALNPAEYRALIRARIADFERIEARGGARLTPDRRTLVALDLDGTVLHMDGSISRRAQTAIAELRARGVAVVIATGRGIQATLPVLEHLGINQGWVVCANGAITLRLDPRLPKGYEIADMRSFDPAPTINRLLEVLPDGIVAVEVPGDGFKVSRPFPAGELIEKETVVSVEEMCAHPVSRVVMRAPGMAVEEFSALVADCGLQSVEYAIGWSAWLDVAPPGVTKASALDALVARLGMEPACTLAAGDGSNDVDMIEWAGVGVVMGSAPKWVRERGDILTEPVWRDGCAAVLHALMARVSQ